jgi:hypothetical protein
MKHPAKMSKLVRSIDEAFENGTLTHPIQYNHAMKVPYLKAVIQESLRLFPPFGVPMARYAPAQGLQISGYHVPAGSKVSTNRLHRTNTVLIFQIGMNAMVIQYDKGVFGEDSYDFRPERWLQSEEQWRAMEKAMLVFGAGTRTCIGKHVRRSSSRHLTVITLIVSSSPTPKCTSWFPHFSASSLLRWRTTNLGKPTTPPLSFRAALFVTLSDENMQTAIKKRDRYGRIAISYSMIIVIDYATLMYYKVRTVARRPGETS